MATDTTTPTYTHTCPAGHRWLAGGTLRLGGNVCPSCGWHRDERPDWEPEDALRDSVEQDPAPAHGIPRPAYSTQYSVDYRVAVLHSVGYDVEVCYDPNTAMHGVWHTGGPKGGITLVGTYMALGEALLHAANQQLRDLEYETDRLQGRMSWDPGY